ncbi:MAG TPA: radical SAM protein, partial [Elusimicrobiales bacterium]|nr:radical SAM protein [Elusimicrobiales bacterium]
MLELKLRRAVFAADRTAMDLQTAYKREKRADTPPHRVFFDWEIIHSCGYKCEYCWFTRAGWEKFTPDSALPSFEAVLRAWERAYELYGCCHINITGGEPSLFPRFFELVARLSQLHFLEIQTNLNFPPEKLIASAGPGRLHIAATFHPAKENADNFISKARQFRQAGFEVYGNFLAHPAQLELVPELRKKFAAAGLPFYVQRYDGPCGGKSYPAAYEESQLAVMEDRAPREQAAVVPRFAPAAPKADCLCRMGQMYAKIQPDGRAYRCRTVAYEKDVRPPFYLGNILMDPAFELSSEALPCG